MKNDGRFNVYIATVRGRKTALKPLTSSPKSKESLLLKAKEIEHEFTQEGQVYLLVPNELEAA